MRKYVEPNVDVILMEERDVVVASGAGAANQEGLNFDGYDYGGNWL